MYNFIRAKHVSTHAPAKGSDLFDLLHQADSFHADKTPTRRNVLEFLPVLPLLRWPARINRTLPSQIPLYLWLQAIGHTLTAVDDDRKKRYSDEKNRSCGVPALNRMPPSKSRFRRVFLFIQVIFTYAPPLFLMDSYRQDTLPDSLNATRILKNLSSAHSLDDKLYYHNMNIKK